MKSSKNVHLMCNILKITKLPNKSDNCLETSFRFHMLWSWFSTALIISNWKLSSPSLLESKIWTAVSLKSSALYCDKNLSTMRNDWSLRWLPFRHHSRRSWPMKSPWRSAPWTSSKRRTTVAEKRCTTRTVNQKTRSRCWANWSKMHLDGMCVRMIHGDVFLIGEKDPRIGIALKLGPRCNRFKCRLCSWT